MKRYIIFLFLLNSIMAYTQPIYSTIRQGNIWMFCDSVGLDFMLNPPQVFKAECVGPDNSVGVIGDTLGRLQYYDKTQNIFSTDVFNRLGQWISTPINPMGNIHSLSWFLPFTNTHTTGYIILYNNKSSLNHYIMNEVYYNRLVDTLNQGLGGWYGSMNFGVSVFDSIRTYGAAPVRHANGRDWWLVARRFSGDTMFVMLATPDTMTIVHRQKIGTLNSIYSLSPTGGANGGELVFSKDGNRLLNVNGEGLIEVYDFDRCNGLLSNAVQVEAPFEQNGVSRRLMYSSCLSPSGRVIYSPQLDMQNQIFDLVQYDLNAPNPTASRFVIYSIPFGNSAFVSVRLAPNNKVYVKPLYSQNVSTGPIDTMTLSVINHPDSVGAGCGFVLNGFYTNSGSKGIYLSQAPNYDLGPIDGSPCDTLGIDTRPADPDTTVQTSQLLWPENLKIYPNPVQEHLLIESGTGLEISGYILYDLNGKEIKKAIFQNAIIRVNIDLKEIPPGQYILETHTQQGIYRKKIVRINME